MRDSADSSPARDDLKKSSPAWRACLVTGVLLASWWLPEPVQAHGDSDAAAPFGPDAAVVIQEPPEVNAEATEISLDCPDGQALTQHFANGASWSLCWESRVRENIVLHNVTFTPPGGQPLRVLGSARLSQLHVAYDDSDVTYNDVTQYGIGGGYLVTLVPDDCPGGELLVVQSRPAVCQQLLQGDDSFRTAGRQAARTSLNLFSVSQVGAYAYIINWRFHDDGTFEPGIGATGALQRSSSETSLPFGRVLSDDNETLWLSHTHNYYWRLDVDLGDDLDDDVVTEGRHVLQADGTRRYEETRLYNEAARRIDPEQMVSWQIREHDGDDARGYLLEPQRQGHTLRRTEVEPYTDYDFFVTTARDCERFASQNARFNPDCLNSVLEYVDGEPLTGADLVLWYRVSFHHVPRNEDQRHMHTHWDSFSLQPINVLAGTAGLVNAPVALTNHAPQLPPQSPRRAALNAEIDDAITGATDPDGDILRFTADGLPPGISITTEGLLSGRATQAGSFHVSVSVTDDLMSSDAEFDWTIIDPNARKKSGAPWWSLWLLALVFVVRRAL